MPKVKNVTFSLPPELIEKFKSYADRKLIPSLNAGVREALEEYVVRQDRELFRQEMEQASKDPVFMKDVEDTMRTFEPSDVAWKEQEEW